MLPEPSQLRPPRQQVSVERAVHLERLALAPDGGYPAFLVQELHVGGGEVKEVRLESLEAHVERDAEAEDGEEDGEDAELTEALGTLGRWTPGAPTHLLHAHLIGG